jgi:hypothetical protein
MRAARLPISCSRFAGNRRRGLRVPFDEPNREDTVMDGPGFDAPDSGWLPLRILFVAITVPSRWFHGFSPENDNGRRRDHYPETSRREPIGVPLAPLEPRS